MSTGIGKETKESLHDLVAALRRDRQRIAVQINLGRKELDDDWYRMEKKWLEVEHHLSEVTEDSVNKAHQLGNEIMEAYRRMKQRFNIGETDAESENESAISQADKAN